MKKKWFWLLTMWWVMAICICQAQVTNGEFISIASEKLKAEWHNSDPTLDWESGFHSFNGFHNLEHTRYPNHNMVSPTSMYFEHIFSPRAEDAWRADFSPDRGPSHLAMLGPNSGEISWLGAESLWDIDCLQKISLTGQAIDMSFSLTINEELSDWLGLMWVGGYMTSAVERNIHFFGVSNYDNEPKWVSFGNNTLFGLDMGNVQYIGTPKLAYEDGARDLNISSTGFQFVFPFYFGFLDGDSDYATTGDTLIYLWMADRAKDMRLTLWNMSLDTHCPAWDWEFIVSNPIVGQSYGYNARTMIVPLDEVVYSPVDRTELCKNPPETLTDWAFNQWQTWLETLPPVPNSPPYIIFEDRIIEMTGKMSWPRGKLWRAPSMFAIDSEDGIISARISEVKDVDINVASQSPYYAIYRVIDTAGDVCSRKLEILVESDDPEIMFDNMDPFLIVLGGKFDLGEIRVSASSSFSGVLPPECIRCYHNVNTERTGRYEVNAVATTLEGNTARATLTVLVLPKFLYNLLSLVLSIIKMLLG